MSTYIRRDDWLQDSMGNVITGVNVYVCGQPASTNVTPPTPLATIYSDPLGANPVTQPLCSDVAGHVEFMRPLESTLWSTRARRYKLWS
jgi:hypothetical protein